MVRRGAAALAFLVAAIGSVVWMVPPAGAQGTATTGGATTTTTVARAQSTSTVKSTTTTRPATTVPRSTTTTEATTTTDLTTTTDPSTTTTTAADTTSEAPPTTTEAPTTTTTEAPSPAPSADPGTLLPNDPVTDADPLPAAAAAAPPVGAEASPDQVTTQDQVATLAQFTYVAFAPWRAAVARRDALEANIASLQAQPSTTIGTVAALRAQLASARAAVSSLAPGYRYARDALADAVVARAGHGPRDAVALSAAWERADPKRLAVVFTALMHVGEAYVFAAAGPQTFDCSGLTLYAWRTAGVNLVHYAITQRQQTLDAAADTLLPGDLVFRFRRPGGHVMLYLGVADLVVQAGGSATGVVITPWGDVDAFGSPLPPPTPPTANSSSTDGGAVFGPTAGTRAVDPDVPFADAFDVAGAHYGVAPRLLAAIAASGTGFRSDSSSADGQTGGLMQLRPAIAAELTVDPSVAAQSIDGAARRLVDLWSRLHNEAAVLAAYHSSLRTVATVSMVPSDPATQAFVADVLRLVSS
jgi:cell wall-associated NlpC family hydrolase